MKEKRFSIVEDILVYTVRSKANPLLQKLMNKSFLDFLEFADTS